MGGGFSQAVPGNDALRCCSAVDLAFVVRGVGNAISPGAIASPDRGPGGGGDEYRGVPNADDAFCAKELVGIPAGRCFGCGGGDT